MSFSNFIEKPISSKNVLFEIDKGRLFDKELWIKEAPGLWKTTYSWIEGLSISTTKYGVGMWGSGLWGKISSGSLPPSPRDKIAVIGGAFINNDIYNLVSSVAVCQTTDRSFFWDTDNQILYINYPGYLRAQTIILGITWGYSSKSQYFNNIYYDGKIDSIPNISVKRDDLFHKIIKFEGGNVTLYNNDGEFNDFGEEDIYGQKVKIKYGGDDLPYDHYGIIYTGYLDKINYPADKINIKVKDERKNLRRKIPINYYDSTTYPDIDSIGSSIQIGYGKINKAPAICLNENEDPAPSTYNFKFIDTTYHNIKSISQVYVEGIKISHTNGSLINGTFDLANTVYTPGQEVSITFEGYVDSGINLIENPMEIIEDLLYIFANIDFINEYYNLSEWETAKSGLPNISLFISDQKSLINIIGDITASFLGTFYIEGDGRFNMKIVDLAKPYSKVIQNDELLGFALIDEPPDEYISSTRIGFNRAWSTGKHSFVYNTELEEQLINKYRSYKQEEFKTLLVNKTDAESYSDKIMGLFGGIFKKYTFTTKMQNIDIEIEDIIDVWISVIQSSEIKRVRMEVIGKNIDYNNNRVTLTGRFISYIEEIEDRLISVYGFGAYKNNVYDGGQ